MKLNLTLIILFGFAITIIPFKSQSQRMLPISTELNRIADRSPNTSWIYFKEALGLPAASLFTNHPTAFGLGSSDEMKLVSTHEDEFSGLTRQKFKQYHSGIRVHGGSVMLFSKNGIAIKAKGRVIQGLPVLAVNCITEDKAIETAIQLMPETDYLWLNEHRVEKYKQRKNDPTATLQPKAELIYVNTGATKSSLAEDFMLCWKVDVGMQRSGSYSIILNAATGDFIRKIPLFHSCNSTSVNTPMNGTQTIRTSQQNRCGNPSDYELWDDCAVDIKVENDGQGSGDDDPICDGNNVWNTTGGLIGDGVQVLWGMRTSYDWFLNNFGWDSYNDGGASIDCTVFYEFGDFPGDHGNNAQYEIFEEDFDFGYGTSSSEEKDSYTCLDIVAHEYTHGVNDYTADLDLGGESGALNESFSDIFGETIEQKIVPLAENEKWYIGQAKSTGADRDMQNPNEFDDPETYLTDEHWDAADEEVHNNACVQDYFFYLLCEGGSGTNANGDNYSVNGIGLDAAITIAWTALNYLDDNEFYIDSRDAWLEAAKDIYGNCSDEMIEVGNAWYAVGVGAQSPFSTLIITSDVSAFSGDNIFQAIDLLFTSGPVNVSAPIGPDVIFYSGREVLLSIGFEVEAGNEFIADINPCTITLHDDQQRLSHASESPGNTTGNLKPVELTSIFPNPFNEQFNLTYTSKSEHSNPEVKVYDVTGKEIFHHSFDPAAGKYEVVIDSRKWFPGMYLLKVLDGGVVLGTERMVKQ